MITTSSNLPSHGLREFISVLQRGFFQTLLTAPRDCITHTQTLFYFDIHLGRDQLKCDGTYTETRFRLSAKPTSPFKSAGASVRSTTGSRGVRISGSNARYTNFRGSVKGTGYPLHSSVPPSFPHPVSHRVPSHFNWSLPHRKHIPITKTN